MAGNSRLNLAQIVDRLDNGALQDVISWLGTSSANRMSFAITNQWEVALLQSPRAEKLGADHLEGKSVFKRACMDDVLTTFGRVCVVLRLSQDRHSITVMTATEDYVIPITGL